MWWVNKNNLNINCRGEAGGGGGVASSGLSKVWRKETISCECYWQGKIKLSMVFTTAFKNCFTGHADCFVYLKGLHSSNNSSEKQITMKRWNWSLANVCELRCHTKCVFLTKCNSEVPLVWCYNRQWAVRMGLWPTTSWCSALCMACTKTAMPTETTWQTSSSSTSSLTKKVLIQ